MLLCLFQGQLSMSGAQVFALAMEVRYLSMHYTIPQTDPVGYLVIICSTICFLCFTFSENAINYTCIYATILSYE